MGNLFRAFDEFLAEFPGYLGLQGAGLEAIHADWPAYPAEHGSLPALLSLACFPRGTRFAKADFIDDAVLLVRQPFGESSDVFSDWNMHVCVWWADLTQLAADGFLAGLLTSRQAVFEFWLDASERFPTMPRPILEEYPDVHGPDSAFGKDGVLLTPEASAFLEQHSADTVATINGEVLELVMPLVVVGRHDAAVRDACILLETKLRKLSGSNSFGQDVVVKAGESLRKNFRVPEGLRRALFAELRAIFKFTRNEFAHNLVPLTAEEGASILLRISRSVDLLERLATKSGGV